MLCDGCHVIVSHETVMRCQEAVSSCATVLATIDRGRSQYAQTSTGIEATPGPRVEKEFRYQCSCKYLKRHERRPVPSQ